MHFNRLYGFLLVCGTIFILLAAGCAPHYPPSQKPSPQSYTKKPDSRLPHIPPEEHGIPSPSLRVIGSPNMYQKEAYTALERSNYRSAESLLERGIRNQPDNSSLWYDLARVKYLQGEYHQSAQLAKKALRLNHTETERLYIRELINGSEYKLQ